MDTIPHEGGFYPERRSFEQNPAQVRGVFGLLTKLVEDWGERAVDELGKLNPTIRLTRIKPLEEAGIAAINCTPALSRHDDAEIIVEYIAEELPNGRVIAKTLSLFQDPDGDVEVHETHVEANYTLISQPMSETRRQLYLQHLVMGTDCPDPRIQEMLDSERFAERIEKNQLTPQEIDTLFELIDIISTYCERRSVA